MLADWLHIRDGRSVMIFSSVPYVLCVWVIHLPVPVIGAGHLHVTEIFMCRWPAFLAAVTCAVSAVVFVSYVVTALTAHMVVGCICGGEVSRCCCSYSER